MKWRVPLECLINKGIDHTIAVTFETIVDEEPMGLYEYECAPCDLSFSFSHSRYGGHTGKSSFIEALDIVFYCLAAEKNNDRKLCDQTIMGLCIMIRAVQNIDNWELIEGPKIGSNKGGGYGYG